jgi:hypothetical protein
VRTWPNGESLWQRWLNLEFFKKKRNFLTSWIATKSSRKNLYRRNFFYWAPVVRPLVWENDLTAIRTHVLAVLNYWMPTDCAYIVYQLAFLSVRCFLDSDPLSDVYVHREEDNYMALMLFPCNRAFIVLPFALTCLLCSVSCFGLLALMKHKSTAELHLSGRWLSGSAWTFGWTFSYCNCTTSFFYGLKFSPICQIHIRNCILIFYLYANKYVA